MAGIGLFQARFHTLTQDEAIHTASAYLTFTRGEHRFDPEHPFLFKYLTALPLLAIRPNVPAQDEALWDAAKPTFYDSWLEARIWSEHWIYESGNNAILMQVLMRLPAVLFLVLLGWFSWWLARRWWGNTVALWTLFLVATTPTLLAHGFTTNTDVPLALTFLVALWRLGEYGQEPTRKNALWVGLALAAALLTKFSAIALLPVAVIWLLLTARRLQLGWRVVIEHILLAVLVIVAAIWLVYFGQSPLSLRDGDAAAFGQQLQLLGIPVDGTQALTALSHLLPLPYLKGLWIVLRSGTDGRPVFLLNTYHDTGVWYFFPAIFALKTQLTVLVISLMSILVWRRELLHPARWNKNVQLLALAALIFGALALKSKLNLGIRHITPLLPLLAMGIAATLVKLAPLVRRSWIPAALVASILLPILTQSGNLLGYADSLVPNQEESYHYFLDSNLDWGQSWERIGQLMRTEFPGQPVYVVRGASSLRYFGVAEQPSIATAGSQGSGAILLAAGELAYGPYAFYQKYRPEFVIDNAYFVFRTDRLVPR
jgi:hypothetical protein